MLVMFAVGVMNLFGMAIVTVTILAEKLLPHPQPVRRLIGAGFVVGGLSYLFG
jgi:predicted metal-binding membrane protein